MGLEAGTYVEDLVTTNPPGGDVKAQGDDHIRLIKNALRNTLKRATRAHYFPISVVRGAGAGDYTILATDENATLYIDTSAGNVVLTPPASAELGFRVRIIKSTTDANAIIIQPSSGAINAVYNRVRRSAPHALITLEWVGSWVASRTHGIPPGTILPFYGPVLPPGFLWADGTTFVAANYQELHLALGSTTTLPDLRGRVVVGRDNMGVGAAGVMTLAGSGISADTVGAAGGTETVTLGVTQIPAHTHGGSTSANGAFDTTLVQTGGASSDHIHQGTTGNDDPDHTHAGGDLYDAQASFATGPDNTSQAVVSAVNASGGGNTGGRNSFHQHPFNTGGMKTAGGAPTDHTHSYQVSVGNHSHTITTDNGTGGGLAHRNVQPTLITNYIVLAE